MELDLANLDSVREFSKVVGSRFPEIHILVNNAGKTIKYRIFDFDLI